MWPPFSGLKKSKERNQCEAGSKKRKWLAKMSDYTHTEATMEGDLSVPIRSSRETV
jgi:hypothetical protein